MENINDFIQKILLCRKDVSTRLKHAYTKLAKRN